MCGAGRAEVWITLAGHVWVPGRGCGASDWLGVAEDPGGRGIWTRRGGLRRGVCAGALRLVRAPGVETEGQPCGGRSTSRGDVCLPCACARRNHAAHPSRRRLMQQRMDRVGPCADHHPPNAPHRRAPRRRERPADLSFHSPSNTPEIHMHRHKLHLDTLAVDSSRPARSLAGAAPCAGTTRCSPRTARGSPAPPSSPAAPLPARPVPRAAPTAAAMWTAAPTPASAPDLRAIDRNAERALVSTGRALPFR